MNYISHLNAAQVQIYEDARLHPGHISLYLALFFYWNLHHFPTEFFANREQLMRMAKIGSKSTYHRLIKELTEWGYVIYKPSRNPREYSTISLSQIRDKSGTLMGRTRSIYESYCPKSVPLTLYNKHIKHNKHITGGKPKSQLEVLDFFKQQNYPQQEALKFFNHYQALGWKIGGNAIIEDWKAAADNWIIRSREFSTSKRSSNIGSKSVQTDYLITSKIKNYAEPL